MSWRQYCPPPNHTAQPPVSWEGWGRKAFRAAQSGHSTWSPDVSHEATECSTPICCSTATYPTRLKVSLPLRRFQTTLTLSCPTQKHKWPARCSWHPPGHCHMTLPVVPFGTPVPYDHFFVEGFVGIPSAKQCIPQGQRYPLSLGQQGHRLSIFC